MSPTLARRLVHALLERLVVGELTVVEGRRERTFGPGGAPRARMCVHDERVWPAFLRGSKGLAETYAEGLWDAPDLTALVRVGARNMGGFDALRRRAAVVREPALAARDRWRRNTRERAREDIAAHYDLGDELFARMLDPTMMYSCAVFGDEGASLEDASLAKLDLVCAKLDLGPEDHLLEIGTGWGGMAVHAAATRGCRVTTTTISRDQHAWAQRRVREEGLEDRVTVLLEDYRDLRGQYDKLVSLEMIEAVGHRDLGTFFSVCSERLAPDGLMLLQAITMDDRAYEAEKASRSFMKTLVFPGGCLPSQEVMARLVARRTDMAAVQHEELGPHYARTLAAWRANVEAAADELDALGYDERFRRLWRLYLCYCEAGFLERRIGLSQLVLAKPRWRGAVRAAAAVPGTLTA